MRSAVGSTVVPESDDRVDHDPIERPASVLLRVTHYGQFHHRPAPRHPKPQRAVGSPGHPVELSLFTAWTNRPSRHWSRPGQSRRSRVVDVIATCMLLARGARPQTGAGRSARTGDKCALLAIAHVVRLGDRLGPEDPVEPVAVSPPGELQEATVSAWTTACTSGRPPPAASLVRPSARARPDVCRERTPSERAEIAR